MSTLNFTEIINEVQTSCPTVYNFLSWLMQLDVNTAKKLAPMTLIYAIIIVMSFYFVTGMRRGQ